MPDFQTERKIFKGNWKCFKCGKDITELPFEPKGTATLKCRDCWKADQNAR
jgi:CxxC-x17-CxxC domain-containing protein